MIRKTADHVEELAAEPEVEIKVEEPVEAAAPAPEPEPAPASKQVMLGAADWIRIHPMIDHDGQHHGWQTSASEAARLHKAMTDGLDLVHADGSAAEFRKDKAGELAYAGKPVSVHAS